MYNSARQSRLWFIATAMVVMTSMSHAQTDVQLRKNLVGEWKEKRIVECEEHLQRMQLWPDGTFSVAGFIGACDKLSTFVWRGTWKVQGHKFIYTTTFSNPPDVYPAGVTYEDQILQVTKDGWEMIEQSTGNKSIAVRLK